MTVKDVEELWPALVKADAERNVGLPVELISAEGYARREGISVEQYIIGVLRAERDRRQLIESVTSNAAMFDGILAEATEADLPVLEYMAKEFGTGRPEDLNSDFLRKLVTRLEERLKGQP